MALELPTGDPLRRIESLPGPRSIERVGSTAVVAHTHHGAVTIVDAALKVQHVLRSFEQPR